MQQLLHGLREEQQGAQSSLQSTQVALRGARGRAIVLVLEGATRYRTSRALATWARAALLLSYGRTHDQRARLEEQLSRERLASATLQEQLHAGSHELTQRAR
eukprot:490324-Prymnesium_polylepis.1